MIKLTNKVKCEVDYTNKFKKQLKKISKQGKNIDELFYVVEKLVNYESLESKYRNHNLINDKIYKDCSECHINPDWLLVYKYLDNKLILLLVATGSHSEIFN